MPPQRLSSVDIAKGIGIILVVVGHNRSIKELAPLLSVGIYLFHMPLFFFLSGLLTPTPLPIHQLMSKCMGLIRPYLTGVLVFLPLQLLQKDHPSNHPLIEKILWGSGNSIYNTPLWFLTCLISGYAVLWLIGAMGLTRKTPPALLTALLGVGVTYWALDGQHGFELLPKDSLDRPLGAPLNIDLAVLAAAFLLLGSKLFPWIKNPPRSTHLVLTLLASSALFVGLMWQYDPRLDLNYRLIQHWPTALACCLAGIGTTLCLSMLLGRHAASLTGPMEYLGRNTLIILVFHSPIQNQLVRHISKHVDLNLGVAFLISLCICFLLSWISDKLINPRTHLRKFFYAK